MSDLLPGFPFGSLTSVSPDSAGQPQWAGAFIVAIGTSATEYAHFDGTAWSPVSGGTSFPSPPFDVQDTTAHIPGTDATWAVGTSSPQGASEPGTPIIELNGSLPAP